MKGNVHEVCLRQAKYPQQQAEKIYTKASDRKKKEQEIQENRRIKEITTTNQKKRQAQMMENRTCHTK